MIKLYIKFTKYISIYKYIQLGGRDAQKENYKNSTYSNFDINTSNNRSKGISTL